MSRPRLFACSGVEILNSEGRHVVPLDTLNPTHNVRICIENVTDAFAKHLSPRMVDLLEIAVYIYAADCSTDRGGAWGNGNSLEPWSRDMKFVVPVRDIDFWKRPDVQDKLTRAVDFTSGDHYSFEFRRLREDRPKQLYFDFAEYQETPFHGLDRVLLFSGGLDSLAGAVETASRGMPMVLVSHRSVAQVDNRQTGLFDALKCLFSVPMLHTKVWANKAAELNHEYTQRSRSFLYSAVAAAVAEPLGAAGIRFFENGVISLNLPLATEALQSRASRTTHPLALDYMRQFYELVTEREFAVDNPYILKTKTDVVSTIARMGAAELIGLSCSCNHTAFKPSGMQHCGTCGQCLDRRIAVFAAGLEQYDQASDYINDVFTGPRRDGYERNVGVDYVQHAMKLNDISENELAMLYGLELSRATRPLRDRSKAALELIGMLKRHAATVGRVVTQQVERHATRFVDASLPPTSLLALVGGLQHRRLPAVREGRDTCAPATNDNPKQLVLSESSEISCSLKVWDDYRIVESFGKQYHLSIKQADCIKVLHASVQEREPGVTAQTWFSRVEELGVEAPSSVRAVFRHDDPARELIKCLHKGLYTLNS